MYVISYYIASVLYIDYWSIQNNLDSIHFIFNICSDSSTLYKTIKIIYFINVTKS